MRVEESPQFTAGQGGSFTVTATASPTPTLTESGALPSGVGFKDDGNGTATLAARPAASGICKISTSRKR